MRFFQAPHFLRRQVPKPPQAELAEPPLPVKPDDINESNAGNQLKRLEQEITYDERYEPPPEARSVAGERCHVAGLGVPERATPL